MIECYAVFEGGGVKGAAFAGALKAAKNNKIKFVGYGGASAGAVIAFLASLGMPPEEILVAMKEKKFITFLDSSSTLSTKLCISFGKKIEKYNNQIDLNRRGFQTSNSIWARAKCFILMLNSIDKKVFKITNVVTVFNFVAIALKVLINKGLHNKQNLKAFLMECAKSNLPNYLMENGKFGVKLSFNDFYVYNKIDLRIVATDVMTGKAIEFSNVKTPSHCIFEALLASSAYPLFFQPSFIDGHVLVDGGVSCNLPTFLFNDANYKKLPIYAFDLSVEESAPVEKSKYGFFSYVSDLIHSAVDASNNIISDVVGGVAVPVVVPNKYTTLNFLLDNKDIDILYKSGLDSASGFFKEHQLSKKILASNSIYHVARSLCGDFDSFLSMTREQLESGICNSELKIWLYVSVDANDSEIVPVSYSFSKNQEFRFHKYVLSEANKNIDCVKSWNEWDLIWSYDNKKKVARFCFPVMKINKLEVNYSELIQNEENKVLALLCFETSGDYESLSLLSRKNYVIDGVEAFGVDKSFSAALSTYSLIIKNALIGHRTLFHESTYI
jgi:NTE family protein